MNDEQFVLWSLLALVREPESKSYKTMFYCLVRRTADQLYTSVPSIEPLTGEWIETLFIRRLKQFLGFFV